MAKRLYCRFHDIEMYTGARNPRIRLVSPLLDLNFVHSNKFVNSILSLLIIHSRQIIVLRPSMDSLHERRDHFFSENGALFRHLWLFRDTHYLLECSRKPQKLFLFFVSLIFGWAPVLTQI